MNSKGAHAQALSTSHESGAAQHNRDEVVANEGGGNDGVLHASHGWIGGGVAQHVRTLSHDAPILVLLFVSRDCTVYCNMCLMCG